MYRGYYYEYAKGVKTGHTEAAGYCLVSTAEKDGVRLLCVVLGGKGTARANGTTDFGSFSDTLTAYRWVFSNYGWRDIVSASDLVCEVPVRYGRDSDGVTVRPAQSISAVLPSADTAGAPQFEQQVTIYSERDGKPLEAPVKAGDEVGELTVSYNGTVYGTVKLVAAVDVAVSKGAYIAGHLRAFFTNPIVLVVLLLVVLAVIGYVLWLVRRRKQIEAERKRRRRAQMEAAEESRTVYRAWNAVCSGTREGRHVTGLRYLPESNELLVYLDSPSWTQEMTLLREIIRARMERAGAHVDGLVFKTTAPGHTPPAAKERLRPATTERPPAPHADLSEAECTEIERQVAPIEDQKLREALENAMRASAEWAKGVQSKKEP